MNVEERMVIAATIQRISGLLSQLYGHPDLPQHGSTRPIILEIVEHLKLIVETTRMTDKQVVITAPANGAP